MIIKKNKIDLDIGSLDVTIFEKKEKIEFKCVYKKEKRKK